MSPAFVGEIRRHDRAAIVEAAMAPGQFDARPWLSELACPAASVVADEDQRVPARRQLELALLTGARTFHLGADHGVAVSRPDRLLPALVDACRSVDALLTTTAA